MLGPQKVLSLPPNLGIISVSERTWSHIEHRNYQGYDALVPFRDAVENRYMPYTHNWRAIYALRHRLTVLNENLDKIYQRHTKAATLCRNGIAKLGLKLYAKGVCSPTVTTVYLPESMSWKELNENLRRLGVIVAGSYGPLANRVFRIGHMGEQADCDRVQVALDALQSVLKKS